MDLCFKMENWKCICFCNREKSYFCAKTFVYEEREKNWRILGVKELIIEIWVFLSKSSVIYIFLNAKKQKKCGSTAINFVWEGRCIFTCYLLKYIVDVENISDIHVSMCLNLFLFKGNFAYMDIPMYRL